MTQLSGFTVSKNCISLDYPIELCIRSMLPLCDEVVVGEMGSTDGTLELLYDMAFLYPKIRVVRIKDWTLERGKMDWFVNALNSTRQHLKYPMALQLDSDEILGDDRETHAIIRECVRKQDAIAVDRLNFITPHGLIPEGECCGKHVVRCGPSNYHWVSDEPHARGEVPLLDRAHIEPNAKIFHVGFLRKPEAYFAKARVVLGAFFNEFDVRLAKAEAEGRHPMSGMSWYNNLVRYDGYYPEAVKQWMEERGHKI